MLTPNVVQGTPPNIGGRARRGGVLAVAVAAIQLGGCAIAASASELVPLDGLGYALLVAGPVALFWRRAAPHATLAVALLATYAYLALSYPRGPFFLAGIVALVNAARTGRRALVWGITAAAYALFVAVTLSSAAGGAFLVGDRVIRDIGVGTWLITGAWTTVALVVGQAMRAQGEWVAEMRRARAAADQARAEQSRRRASDERLRIARELHDVLGHHLSLINVRAGVALHLLETRPDQTRDALAAIKQASAEALREVRGVLATLAPDDEAAPRTPAPGIAAVDELVAEARAAGTPVSLQRTGTVRRLPGEVERAAYRIVREALTNVRRHAGPGASVSLTLDYAPDGLTVRLVDDGSSTLDRTREGGEDTVEGNGIAGMAERATALGGRLHAGPDPRGTGFVVEAFLPAREDE